MTRSYWLSFCNADKPAGQRFLGAAIVDVSEEAAEQARVEIATLFPHAQPGAEWIAAATRLAWAAGCNPGGEVATLEVTGVPELADAPRNTLMQRRELHRHGLIDGSDARITS